MTAEAKEVLEGVFERHFGDWESPPEQEVPRGASFGGHRP